MRLRTSTKEKPGWSATRAFFMEEAEPVRIPVTDVLDLHSIPARDAKAVVEEYLHEACERGFRALRIIHGRGIGIQRQMVRSILARTPFVEDYRDAPLEAGGWGATIVTLTVPRK